MKKKEIEKLRKIKSIENYLNFVEKEMERVLPEYRSVRVDRDNKRIVIKEFKTKRNVEYKEDDIDLIVNAIRFYVEFWDYINNLKKGDIVEIAFIDKKRYKGTVKRINKDRKYNQIKSITVDVEIPTIYGGIAISENNKIGILNTNDSFYTIAYRNIPLHELEMQLDDFFRYINQLSINPEHYISKIKEFMNQVT